MNESPIATIQTRPVGGELPVPPFPWPESIEFVLARYERQLINHALQNADGVKRRAAQLLGISRYALERRLTRVAALLDGASAQRNNKAAAGGSPAV
jgi:DNA-binding NtrC family response regulator